MRGKTEEEEGEVVGEMLGMATDEGDVALEDEDEEDDDDPDATATAAETAASAPAEPGDRGDKTAAAEGDVVVTVLMMSLLSSASPDEGGVVGVVVAVAAAAAEAFCGAFSVTFFPCTTNNCLTCFNHDERMSLVGATR